MTLQHGRAQHGEVSFQDKSKVEMASFGRIERNIMFLNFNYYFSPYLGNLHLIREDIFLDFPLYREI